MKFDGLRFENMNEILLSAVRTRNLDLLEMCINDGADINYRDEFKSTALCYAVVSGDFFITKYLFERGADVNYVYEKKKTLLHIAVEIHGDKGIDIVKLLIGRGIAINAKDRYGNTALWYATLSYVVNIEVITFLIGNGADVYIIGDLGWSVYSHAKEHDRKELVEILDKAKGYIS